MADVLASGVIYFSDGTTVPVQNTAQTEGSKEEILTDAEITTVAQSLGDYGPKKTVVAGYICVKNAAAYCYIEFLSPSSTSETRVWRVGLISQRQQESCCNLETSSTLTLRLLLTAPPVC